jgi:hypothetical protein
MNFLAFLVMLAVVLCSARAYDPSDKEIETIIPKPGDFEAFYPRESNGISNSVARAPHAHGSFFQHRNPGEWCSQYPLSFSLSLSLLFLQHWSTLKIQPLMGSALTASVASISIKKIFLR